MLSQFWTRLAVPACIAALAACADAQQIRRCANEAPSMEELAQAANLSRLDGLEARSDIPTPISIPTYVHILASSATVAGGYLSDAAIQGQMDVLNEDFGAHNISFNVLGVTRTINAAWATDGDGQNMRRQLRQGGYDTLNLYFMRSVSGYLGYCSLPAAGVVEGSTRFISDGCAILASSIPGGSAAPYNGGRTATHEIGHWLNLFHTFDGGCSCVGDMIHDTPAEARDHYGCPIGLDSCPDRPGLDPIHNFMAYTDDACMEEFTRGQAFRMRSAWYNLRLP